MDFWATLSAFALLVSLGVIVSSKPQGKHTSLSVHAASRVWSYWLFGVSLTVCSSVFCLYLLTLGPRVGAPITFGMAVVVGWMCTLLTAWIPDRTGEITIQNAHWDVSFGLALMMTVMVGSLAAATKVILPIRVIAAVIAVWYLFTLYLSIFVKASRQYFLVYQAINIVSFLTILIASAVTV